MLNFTKLTVSCALMGFFTASTIAQPVMLSATGGTTDLPAELPTGIASALNKPPTTTSIPPTPIVTGVLPTDLPPNVIETIHDVQLPSSSEIRIIPTMSAQAQATHSPVYTDPFPISTENNAHTLARRRITGEQLAKIILVAIVALCVIIAAAPCVYCAVLARAQARDEEQLYARGWSTEEVDGSLAQSLSARYFVVTEQPRGHVLDEKFSLMETIVEEDEESY